MNLNKKHTHLNLKFLIFGYFDFLMKTETGDNSLSQTPHNTIMMRELNLNTLSLEL